MPIVGLSHTPVPILRAGDGPVLFVNNSETDTVYIDFNPGVTSPVPVAPQASVTLDGTRTWYGTSGSSKVVECLTLPGGVQWDNPVGVSIALSALGLATADLQNSQMAVGIPPNVPSITSASTIQGMPPASPVTVVTPNAPFRIWGVNLTMSCASNSSYSGGNNRFFAWAQQDGTNVLAIIEQGLSDANQFQSDVIYVPFNGLECAANTPLELIINTGISVPNVEQIASCVFFYSIP